MPNPSLKAASYGEFWARFTAILIDLLVIWIVRWPIALVFWALSDDFSIWGGIKGGANNPALNLLYIVINLGILFAYFVVMDVQYQATLGKMVMNLRVVGAELQPITFRTALIRETIGKAISFIPLLMGFIWAAFDPMMQAWHDKIAGTYVVKRIDKQ